MSEKQKTELPKWPFLVGDIVLILLACFIVIASPKPMTPMGIFACALSVILGMLVFITPYIIEHLTQQQRIKLKQAQAEETLLKTVELASDLLNRTESIHAELMKGVLSVKQVPVTLEEKTEELSEVLDSESLASSITELSDLLNRLEAQPINENDKANDDTIKRLDEILEATLNQPTTDLSQLSDSIDSKLEELRNELIEKLQEIETAQETVTLRSQSEDTIPATKSDTENGNENPKELDEDNSNQEPSPEENNKEEDNTPTVDEGETGIDEEPEMESDHSRSNDEDDSEDLIVSEEILDPTEDTENSVQHNEDGATRLLVGAFIGISNKLYIRGEGPGLDWDKGIPMELVGIGKWEWKTYDANSTVNCKVLINDEQWTDTDNITIEPNTTVETTASF